MTKNTNFASVDEYVNSAVYNQEKGRIQGYNEVMRFLNQFSPFENPEAYKIAQLIEMEFAINCNRSLTPVADELGVFLSA